MRNLQVNRSHFDVVVKGTRGEHLGGRDFDAVIFDLLDERIRLKHGQLVEQAGEVYRQRLLAQCERMKIELSTAIVTE